MLTYCFDLDGTLCTLTAGDYECAQPLQSRISHVNLLFSNGHRILIFTARGASSGKDWRRLTQNQLSQWGVCFHELIFGKPHADLFIDDKAQNSESYEW